MSKLCSLTDFCFPYKNIVNKSSEPKPSRVRSKEIDKLKDECNLYFDYYINTGSNDVKNIYKRCKKKLYKLVKETRIRINDGIINNSSNKSKAMWNIVRKEGNVCKIKNKNCDSISPCEFNAFFISKVEELLGIVSMKQHDFDSSLFLNNIPKPKTSFNFHLVEVKDIEKAIIKMKSSRCEDIYNLSSVVLKYGIDFIKEALTHIINSCILESVIPDNFKFVKVLPVYKKGNHSSLESYRPISLVPVVSKVLEIVLNNQIVEYFEQNRIFDASQFGYRAGLGTVKAATSFLSKCISGLDSRDVVSLKLYDLSKAFDTVSHSILLDKLRFYGFEDSALAIMQSYLSGRNQKVVMDVAESGFLPVSHGVPQGSILGPILFIIYINDLPFNLSAPSVSSYLFADDLSICFNSRSRETLDVQVKSISSIVQNWCNANLLCINDSKIQESFITYNKSIENVQSSVNFLGFVIDQNLKWEEHIIRVSSKISKGIYLIRKLRQCLSLDVLKTVYFAHIHSHLCYGTLLWGHQTLVQKLFKLQKVCVRLMCGLPVHGHCKPSFVKLNIMTVQAIFIFQCLLYIKENVHLYDELGSTHNYDTRHSNKLEFIRCNYGKTQKTFYYMSIKFYNFLPLHLKQLPLIKFKKVLRDILTVNCIYKTDDFFDISFGDYCK